MKKSLNGRKGEATRRLRTTGHLLDKAQEEVEAANSPEIPTIGIWCEIAKAKARLRQLVATIRVERLLTTSRF
jgi:hypothetical protein